MDEIELRQTNPVTSIAKPEFSATSDPGILEVAPEEFRHLHDYVQVILKRRWVILTCLLVVFSTVAVSTLKKAPVYEGRVLVEINPEQPNVLNFRKFCRSVRLTSTAIAKLNIACSPAGRWRSGSFKICNCIGRRSFIEITVSWGFTSRIPNRCPPVQSIRRRGRLQTTIETPLSTSLIRWASAPSGAAILSRLLSLPKIPSLQPGGQPVGQ